MRSACSSSARSRVSGVRGSCDAFATPLGVKGGLQPSEKVVENRGELVELIVRTVKAERSFRLLAHLAGRLGQVVVGTQLEPVDPVLDASGRGEHEHPARAASGHQAAADLVAVRDGQRRRH